MALVWKMKDGVTFEPLESNNFMIQFFNAKDKERVLECRPWTFDDNLLLLELLMVTPNHRK